MATTTSPIEEGSFAAAVTGGDETSGEQQQQQSQQSTQHQQTGAEDVAAQAAADAAAKSDTDKAAADAAAKAEADKGKSAEEVINPNLSKDEKKVEHEEDETKKPAGMTDKAFANFREMRVAKRDAEKRATDLETQTKALQAKLDESAKASTDLEAMKKELEATKQKLADYEGEVYVSRVESHPKFKAEIKAPMDAITASATAIATRYEIEPYSLLRAIQEPDETKATDLLNDAITDMKVVDQNRITQMADRYRELQAKAGDMRKDAGKRLEDMTREQQAESERHAARTAKDYQDAVTSGWDAAQQLYPAIRKVNGHEKWNAHLDAQLRAAASRDVNNLPVEDVAKGEIARRILPEIEKVSKYYQSQWEKEKARADAAEARMSEYLKTAPKSGAGGNGSESSTDDDGDGSFVGSLRSRREAA